MTTRPFRHSMVLTGITLHRAYPIHLPRNSTRRREAAAFLTARRGPRYRPRVSDFQQSYSAEIAGSADDCFAVLTDFDAYPKWSGPVTECRIIDRHPDGLPRRVAFALDF